LIYAANQSTKESSIPISPYAKPLPQPLPETERGVSNFPPALSGKGDGGLGRKPLPQPLPGTERGVSNFPPCPLREGGRGVR